MPIFTLTLEERATCPRSCIHWRDCYGNKMNWSARLKHGKDLEERIKYDIRRLARDHRRGFVVRLHVLGDFYSVQYVRLWQSMLALYPELRIFGYTAWPSMSELGLTIRKMNYCHPTRCIIRFSNYPHEGEIPRTITLNTADEAPKHVIVCPAQTGKTDCCGTCALCWAVPDKTIAFLRH